MGDLGFTFRAAAISCSWFTSSVMDSRSSGLTLSVAPAAQRARSGPRPPPRARGAHPQRTPLRSRHRGNHDTKGHDTGSELIGPPPQSSASSRRASGRSAVAKPPRGWRGLRGRPPRALHAGLTDEAVEHGVPGVVGRDRVLPVDYAKLRSVFERVLPEAQQVQDAAQGLWGRGGGRGWRRGDEDRGQGTGTGEGGSPVLESPRRQPRSSLRLPVTDRAWAAWHGAQSLERELRGARPQGGRLGLRHHCPCS